MKQHFSTVQDFTEQLAASGLSVGAGLMKVPDDVALLPNCLLSTIEPGRQPASVGAGVGKRQLGRTNSMQDVKDALGGTPTPVRTSAAAAAAGEASTVTGEASTECCLCSTLHAN